MPANQLDKLSVWILKNLLYYPPLLPVAIAHIHSLHAIHTAFTSKDLGKVVITTKHLPYERWLKDWTSQLMEPAYRLRIPAAATRINSLLVTDNWCTMLADYPNKPLINFFTSGIQEGFRNCFTSCSTKLKSAKWNLQCAVEHPEVVERYLADEVALGHVSGETTW